MLKDKLIRVTQLEQFRKYLSGCSYVSEENLISSITGEFTGNNKTRIGTAGHLIIETGHKNLFVDDDNTWIVPIDDEYFARFNAEQIKILLTHRQSMPSAYHELKHGKDYQTQYGKIHVGGTQDIINGIHVHDTKFVFRSPDLKNYTESCQWKFYLEFLGMDYFYFDLFEFHKYDDSLKLNVSTLSMTQHAPVVCVRYDRMEADNQNLVETFMEWIHYRKLTKYLTDKQKYYNE